MTDFRDEFIRSGGRPIKYEGREVHASIKCAVQRGDRFVIRFVEAAESPKQGLRISARGANLEIAGEQATRFILWTDTAPEEVRVTITQAKRGAEVVFRNVWQDEKYGATLEGMNYAGIRVENSTESTLWLHCSDGWGPANFEDLVAHLIHLRTDPH